RRRFRALRRLLSRTRSKTMLARRMATPDREPTPECWFLNLRSLPVGDISCNVERRSRRGQRNNGRSGQERNRSTLRTGDEVLSGYYAFVRVESTPLASELMLLPSRT